MLCNRAGARASSCCSSSTFRFGKKRVTYGVFLYSTRHANDLLRTLLLVRFIRAHSCRRQVCPTVQKTCRIMSASSHNLSPTCIPATTMMKMRLDFERGEYGGRALVQNSCPSLIFGARVTVCHTVASAGSLFRSVKVTAPKTEHMVRIKQPWQRTSPHVAPWHRIPSRPRRM